MYASITLFVCHRRKVATATTWVMCNQLSSFHPLAAPAKRQAAWEVPFPLAAPPQAVVQQCLRSRPRNAIVSSFLAHRPLARPPLLSSFSMVSQGMEKRWSIILAVADICKYALPATPQCVSLCFNCAMPFTEIYCAERKVSTGEEVSWEVGALWYCRSVQSPPVINRPFASAAHTFDVEVGFTDWFFSFFLFLSPFYLTRLPFHN